MSQLNHTIDIQNQVTDAEIDLTGTPFALQYRSDRVPGRQANDTVTISVSDDSVPEPLKRIELEISAAGRKVTEEFPPEPDQDYTYVWPRRNAYGNSVQGERSIDVRLGYVYDLVYVSPEEFDQSDFDRSFAGFSDADALEADRDRMEVTSWQRWSVPVGGWDATAQRLGGWNVDVHHAYDPVSETLYLGDGRQRSSANIASVASVAAGAGQFRGVNPWERDEELPGTEASLINPTDVAAAPDGSLYVADAWADRVYQIDSDGTLMTLAGSHETTGPLQGDSTYDRENVDLDGLRATEAPLNGPESLAVGKDGLYVLDSHYVDIPLVVRVNPDGTLTTVAGGGEADPDGVSAMEADVNDCSQAITVTEDGSLYLGRSVLAKITPDGMITTVAGDGERYLPNLPPEETVAGIPASQVSGLDIGGIDIGPDGDIYFSSSASSVNAVYRIGSDGILIRIAGGGTIEVEQALGEEVPATDVVLQNVWGVTVDATGDVYVSDGGDDNRILSVESDGTLDVVAGSGSRGSGSLEEVPATRAEIAGPAGLDLGPDGSLYVSQGLTGYVRQVRTAMPGLSGGDSAVASEDGDQVYVFDSSGRHVRTLHALTGAMLYSFEYEEGYLSTIEDGDGNVTRIERDVDGNPIAVVSPYGQRTTLETRDDGMLTGVTNPAEETYEFAYDEGGLLINHAEPGGSTTSFVYNELGRLIKERDNGKKVTDLNRTWIDDGFEIQRITPEFREASYFVNTQDSNEQIRINQCCNSNAVRKVLNSTDATTETTYPNGMRSRTVRTPDSRFGMQSPFPGLQVIETPGGLSSTLESEETVILDEPDALMSVTELTRTVTTAGVTYTTTYDGAANSYTVQTPRGRTLSIPLDEQGRISGLHLEDFAPISVEHDEVGNISLISLVDYHLSFEYGDSGRINAIRNALGSEVTFEYDEAGRVESTTLPEERSYEFDYNDQGTLNELLMPNGAGHEFEYAPDNLPVEYAPPLSPPYRFKFNKDDQPTTLSFPSGRTLTNEYNGAGELTSQRYPAASIDLSHGSGLQIKKITRRPANDDTPQELSAEYDGQLTTRITYDGLAKGRFNYTYGNAFRMSSISYPNGERIELDYDADGKLSTYGPFMVSRNGPAGEMDRISGEGRDVTVEYDETGNVTARTYSVNGRIVYRVEFTYDAAGRITERIETVDNEASVRRYEYDSNGQITTVTRNNSPFERYEYDANGNRTLRRVDGEEWRAQYNSEDQLHRLGDVDYTYDDDGFVVRFGDVEFNYSVTGELVQAVLADGKTVRYTYDGFGRRVAKTDSDGRTQYLYGNPLQPFQISAVRDPSDTLTTYHYTGGGHLFALRRDGSWYFTATDQVGSPRVVFDTNGSIIHRIEYDSFGHRLEADQPPFEFPIGFAGGLNDPTTGLVRFGFRDYNPVSGRWTAKDPVLFNGGDFNLYTYARNDPVNVSDPHGLYWEPSFWDSVMGGLGATSIGAGSLGTTGVGTVGAGGAGTLATAGAGVIGAGLAGYGVGSLIDNAATYTLGESLGEAFADTAAGQALANGLWGTPIPPEEDGGTGTVGRPKRGGIDINFGGCPTVPHSHDSSGGLGSPAENRYNDPCARGPCLRQGYGRR